MNMPAIDIHGHFGPYVSDDDSIYSQWLSVGADEVTRRAREVGIRLTVVSATKTLVPEGHGASDIFGGNQAAVKVTQKNPELLFWATLDPTVEGSFQQVGELLEHRCCVGIKLHPTLHHYEIAEEGEDIFRFAADRNALILSHSGDPYAFPEDFIPFANTYPQVRLILAHLGHDSKGGIDRQVRAIQQCKHANVWVDTSSKMSMYAGLVEWSLKELGSDRLLFGTDTPVNSVAAQKARIEYAAIADDVKHKILWENAAALLGDKAPTL